MILTIIRMTCCILHNRTPAAEELLRPSICTSLFGRCRLPPVLSTRRRLHYQSVCRQLSQALLPRSHLTPHCPQCTSFEIHLIVSTVSHLHQPFQFTDYDVVYTRRCLPRYIGRHQHLIWKYGNLWRYASRHPHVINMSAKMMHGVPDMLGAGISECSR